MNKLISLYVNAQSMMKSMMKSKMKDERGATMVEYALMAALIAVVCIGAVTAVGTDTAATFTAVETAL